MRIKIYKMIPIFLVLLLIVTPYVLADENNGPISSKIEDTGSDTVTEIVSPAQKIYGSAVLIIRIVAFSAIIFTGVRYIFLAADQRAEVKKSLIYIIIGSSIVFGTTIIIDIVLKIDRDVL